MLDVLPGSPVPGPRGGLDHLDHYTLETRPKNCREIYIESDAGAV
jgi:hypothetical protein